MKFWLARRGKKRSDKNNRSWWLCATEPAQHAARRHASYIAHFIYYSLNAHDVTEWSIRENVSDWGGGRKIVCLCVWQAIWLYDFVLWFWHVQSIFCDLSLHIKIPLHFQFIGGGGSEAWKLLEMLIGYAWFFDSENRWRLNGKQQKRLRS